MYVVKALFRVPMIRQCDELLGLGHIYGQSSFCVTPHPAGSSRGPHFSPGRLSPSFYQAYFTRCGLCFFPLYTIYYLLFSLHFYQRSSYDVVNADIEQRLW